MSKSDKRRLTPAQLTKRLPANWTPWTTTAELPPSKATVGQERAMRAIEVGLKIPTRGFNIYVAGEAGSGKTSILKRLLKERAAAEPVGQDLVYVTNFRHKDQPQPLRKNSAV